MKYTEREKIKQIILVFTILFCTGTCDLGLRFYARSFDSQENADTKEFILSEEKGEMIVAIENEDPENPIKEDIVLKFLRTVEEIERNTDNCTAGTNVSLGEGVVDQYGVRRFRGEALVAVNRANFLTRIWKNAPPEVLDSEYLLYTLVRSMVEIDDDIFGAGNCYDAWGYKDYDLFCAFAYRLPNNEILAKDLAVQYKYLGNDSEWFWEARQRAKKAIDRYNTTLIGFNVYRYNETTYLPKVKDEVLTVGYEDGHWSKPYFDCGGGNIWMMTYTVPFFGYDHENKTYHFKGTSGIDIDLRNVDIDQCPPEPGSIELNVFAGSDKCRRTTTKCEPIPGLGFRRGSYKCVCQIGYYFPIPNAIHRYFNGTIIEDEYEKKLVGLENSYEVGFECLPCAEGCDECQDTSPCILSLGWAQRTAILVVACIIIGFLPVVVWFTFKFADVKVLKAASPVLLRIILLGAFLLYGPIIVLYPEPSEITCTLRVWLRETGFAVSYGALLLKTWRISVVFRVRSAQRVKITDNSLIKRLAILVSVICGFLTVRTVVARPQVVIGKSSEGLKAYLCSTDWWDHSSGIGELCFLLWGIRLCFVVRKAPSEFNESKFISWAIYNEFLLSMFLNISMLFLQSPANPDLLYIIFFVHSQLTTTVVVFLLFGSKAYMVYKGLGKGETGGGGDSADRTSSKYISKPKSQVTQMSHMPLTSSTSTQDKTSDVSDQEGSTLEQDIQEEFKRLYMQLELLKSKNMKIGNPHLTYKLSAMTEAANMVEPSSDSNAPNSNSNTKRKVVINLDEASDDVEV